MRFEIVQITFSVNLSTLYELSAMNVQLPNGLRNKIEHITKNNFSSIQILIVNDIITAKTFGQLYGIRLSHPTLVILMFNFDPKDTGSL